MRASSGSPFASPIALTCEKIVEAVSCSTKAHVERRRAGLFHSRFLSCECSSFMTVVIACFLCSVVEILVEAG